MCARCASARAPALYAPRARCPSSLLLAAAIARLEHLFAPSPPLPFLRFAPLACAARPEHLFSPSPQLPFSLFVRSSVPSRHSNTCSPRRPDCPSCASRARLRCATRTFVLPVAPVVPPALRAHSPRPLACPRRARPPADHRRARPPADHRRARPPADYRRAARRPAWAWACAGAGMCQGYL